jgi:hypothetical protein
LRVVVMILICRCTSSAAILSCRRVPLQITCAACSTAPEPAQQQSSSVSHKLKHHGCGTLLLVLIISVHSACPGRPIDCYLLAFGGLLFPARLCAQHVLLAMHRLHKTSINKSCVCAVLAVCLLPRFLVDRHQLHSSPDQPAVPHSGCITTCTP